MAPRSLEIEVKYPVGSFEPVETKLAELGHAIGPCVPQADHYFAHPQRNFSETDEALRLRVLPDACRLTYKGPKLDRATKTRHEIEIPFDLAYAGEAAELLGQLGFRSVAVVKKNRRQAVVPWNDLVITVALDTVERVGKFVELEVVAETERYEPIRQALFRFAATLQLVESERRSYLELWLAHRPEWSDD